MTAGNPSPGSVGMPPPPGSLVNAEGQPNIGDAPVWQSGGFAKWGPTGSGTTGAFATIVGDGSDQTALVQAAATNAPPGGTVVIAPGSGDQPVLVSAPIVISQPLNVYGTGMAPIFGGFTAGGNVDSWNFPVQSPYLTGSVVKQMAANADVFQITGAAGIAVNFRDIGLTFGTPLANTGHGIFNLPPTPSNNPVFSGTYNNGILGAQWENVMCWGHDGNHYAFNLMNPILCNFRHCMSFGGGGLNIDSDPQSYGNVLFDGFYASVFLGGTAHGIQIGNTSPNAAGVVLCNFRRPQVWLVSATEFPSNPPTNAQKLINSVKASFITMDSPDLESNISGATATFTGITVTGTPYSSLNMSGLFPTAQLGVPFQGFKTAFYPYNVVTEMVNQVSGIPYAFSTTAKDAMYMAGSVSSGSTAIAATAAAGAQSGGSPPAPVIAGTLLRGTVTFGTGTGPSAGAMVVVSHAQGDPFSNLTATVTPTNAATAALGPYVNAPSSKTSFTVSCANAPSASQANTVYAFNYHLLN